MLLPHTAGFPPEIRLAKVVKHACTDTSHLVINLVRNSHNKYYVIQYYSSPSRLMLSFLKVRWFSLILAEVVFILGDGAHLTETLHSISQMSESLESYHSMQVYIVT